MKLIPRLFSWGLPLAGVGLLAHYYLPNFSSIDNEKVDEPIVEEDKDVKNKEEEEEVVWAEIAGVVAGKECGYEAKIGGSTRVLKDGSRVNEVGWAYDQFGSLVSQEKYDDQGRLTWTQIRYPAGYSRMCRSKLNKDFITFKHNGSYGSKEGGYKEDRTILTETSEGITYKYVKSGWWTDSPIEEKILSGKSRADIKIDPRTNPRFYTHCH